MLLEGVSKHNREYGHRGEPNTIKGVLLRIYESDWLVLIKTYPSNERLEETKFDLDSGIFIQIMNYLLP